MQNMNAYKGGMFYSTNGGRINLIGSVDSDHSIKNGTAVEGAFAYVEGQ